MKYISLLQGNNGTEQPQKGEETLLLNLFSQTGDIHENFANYGHQNHALKGSVHLPSP